MSEWKNPDGSTSVGIKEDFVLFVEPKEEPVKELVSEKPKKKTSKKK